MTSSSSIGASPTREHKRKAVAHPDDDQVWFQARTFVAIYADHTPLTEPATHCDKRGKTGRAPRLPAPQDEFWLAELLDDVTEDMVDRDARVRITWLDRRACAAHYHYAYDDVVDVQTILCPVDLKQRGQNQLRLTPTSKARVERSLQRTKRALGVDGGVKHDERTPPKSKRPRRAAENISPRAKATELMPELVMAKKCNTRHVDGVIAGKKPSTLHSVEIPKSPVSPPRCACSTHFNRTVHVVRGKIGDIQEINRRRMDGIAFPTTRALVNPLAAPAATVFQRAGQDLDQHIREVTRDLSGDIGNVMVTPGFGTGVQQLIHCVEPHYTFEMSTESLELMYKNILEVVERENLSCVAIVPISTGFFGMSVSDGAAIAMRTIERFLQRTEWQGILGFVCPGDYVYKAFTARKNEMVNESDELVGNASLQSAAKIPVPAIGGFVHWLPH